MTANGTWQVPDDYKPQPCASRCPTCGEPCHAPTPEQQRDTAIADRACAELARLEEKHAGVKREFLMDPAAEKFAMLRRIIDGEE